MPVSSRPRRLPVRYRRLSNSLTKSLVRRLAAFALISYSIFVLVLCFHFFKLEKSKFDLLSQQISSTLKSSVMVKDEISIRASLNRILEVDNLLGIEVIGSGIGRLRDSQSDFKPTKFETSNFLSILTSDVLAFEHDYKLYPNTDEIFTIRFFYRNSSRTDILLNSLFVTVILIGSLGLLLTLGSKILIDREMMYLSIDEEKSKLASRIFHLMKSDVKQMIELIDRSGDLNKESRILMRTILRSIHGTASKFIKGEGDNPYSIDRYQRLPASAIVDEMIVRKQLEYSRRKSLSLIFDQHKSDSTATLRTIPNELKLAISNIVDNSFDATKDGGTITFAVEATDQVVSISIADNGIGIPKKNLDKVFEMGRSFKPNGNGLGLYQAREIVSSLGGELKISSAEGKGTTVTISMLRESEGIQYDQKDVASFDYVLIDDSKVRRLNGQKRAELKGKKLGSFKNVADFCESVAKYNFDKQIPIYLDSDLGEDEPGEVSAKQLYYENGFENIILYTAGNIADLRARSMPWIRDIIGKEEVQNLPV